MTENNTTQISHEVTLYSEPLFHVGSFSVTNSLLVSWVVVVIIVSLAFILKKRMKKIPARLQTVAEFIIEQTLSLADQVTGSRKLSYKIAPLALSVFIFVLLNNWIGILPGVGSIGFIETSDTGSIFVPFLRGGTADINTTLALGLLTVIGANIFGIISLGFWKTLNRYFNFSVFASIPKKIKKDPFIIVIAPINFFVGLIEFVGELAKIASLSFRLFGNVFAGEVLLVSMSALVAYVVPIPFLFLEILVGVIQALIFGMLTLVYFTIASQDHSEEH